MIWIICAIISTLFLITGVVLFLYNRKQKLRVIYVLGVLFIASYVAYIPVFLQKYDLVSSLFAGIFNLLQLMTINADYLKHYELIKLCVNAEVFAVIYLAILAILHLALPIVSAISAVALLLRFLSSVYFISCPRTENYSPVLSGQSPS